MSSPATSGGRCWAHRSRAEAGAGQRWTSRSCPGRARTAWVNNKHAITLYMHKQPQNVRKSCRESCIVLVCAFRYVRNLLAMKALPFSWIVFQKKWHLFQQREALQPPPCAAICAFGWFDRLLLTDETLGPQSCKAVNCWWWTLLLPASYWLNPLQTGVSEQVKPRHNPEQALRVNSGVHISLVRRAKDKEGAGGLSSSACACMHTSHTLGKLWGCFQPPDRGDECFLLLNVGSSLFVLRDLAIDD